MDFIKIEVVDLIIKINMMVKKFKCSYLKVKVIVERVESYEDF